MALNPLLSQPFPVFIVGVHPVPNPEIILPCDTIAGQCLGDILIALVDVEPDQKAAHSCQQHFYRPPLPQD